MGIQSAESAGLCSYRKAARSGTDTTVCPAPTAARSSASSGGEHRVTTLRPCQQVRVLVQAEGRGGPWGGVLQESTRGAQCEEELCVAFRFCCTETSVSSSSVPTPFLSCPGVSLGRCWWGFWPVYAEVWYKEGYSLTAACLLPGSTQLAQI